MVKMVLKMFEKLRMMMMEKLTKKKKKLLRGLWASPLGHLHSH